MGLGTLYTFPPHSPFLAFWLGPKHYKNNNVTSARRRIARCTAMAEKLQYGARKRSLSYSWGINQAYVAFLVCHVCFVCHRDHITGFLLAQSLSQKWMRPCVPPPKSKSRAFYEADLWKFSGGTKIMDILVCIEKTRSS